MSGITIPATGSGTQQPSVATEVISSDHYQLFKLIDGNVGSLSPVGTSANPIFARFPALQPVQVTSYPSPILTSVVSQVLGNIVGSVGMTQLAGPWTFVGTVANRGVLANSTFVSSVEAPVLIGGYALPSGTVTDLPVGSFGAVIALFDRHGRQRVVVDSGFVNVASLTAFQGGAPWAVTGSVNITTGNSPVVVVGDIAAGSLETANSFPVKMGGVAVTSAFPAYVGSGTRVSAVFDRGGRQLVQLHAPITMRQNRWNSFTGPLSGTVVISCLTLGGRIVVTDYNVQAGSATSGIMGLYFARSGAPINITVGSGTALFYGELAPSATVKPGAVKAYTYPEVGDPNDALRISLSTSMQAYVTVGYYEVL